MSTAANQLVTTSLSATNAPGTPHIAVVGVGGAGGNAINTMIETGGFPSHIHFVAANTDAQALDQSLTPHRVQLGSALTSGLGAGAKPNVGRDAANASMAAIEEQLRGRQMCFITAGMGGGTGTGAAPVIARAAKRAGLLTVAVVSKPFGFEGSRRSQLATRGLEELRPEVDTLIVVPNQKLLEVAGPETTFASAFRMSDAVLMRGVRAITDLILTPGLVNLDFADVSAVMRDRGMALMGVGEASGEGRATAAVEQALENPLLESTDISEAEGVLASFSGGSDLSLFEIEEALSLLRPSLKPDAQIIFGASLDEALDGKLRISLVVAGLKQEQQRPAQAASRPRRSSLKRQPRAAVTSAPQSPDRLWMADPQAKLLESAKAFIQRNW